MTKRVEIGPTAYRWLLRHHFVSEEAVIGIVLHCPINERKYLDDDKFQVTFKRRKDSKFVNVTLWVQERQTTFYVGKIHSERI
jgi:hypothetical protein